MRKLFAALAVVALAALAGSAPTAAAAPAAARDWSRTVTVTPAGTYVLGNPAAKVKLVEYLSLTCPHCAHLSGEASAPLTSTYIAKGLVSLEVRHAIRDSLDLTATLLARCNGPQPFFANLSALFASQETWVGAAIAFQEADKGAVQKLPPAQALAAFARGSGLDKIMAGRGLPPARVNACLADRRQTDLITAQAKEAWETRGIPGTPAFLINGVQNSGVRDWASLDAGIRSALG